MNLQGRWRRLWKLTLMLAALVVLPGLLAGVGISQSRTLDHDPRVGELPEAEFHMARMIYRTNARAGSHGFSQPMWAVDYPFAEEHFFGALRRLTNIQVSEDSRHLDLMDDRLFMHPFLFLQQPGAGRWVPTVQEAARLREYLLRGGFMWVDDFHGDDEFRYFASVMADVLPGMSIVDIPETDPLLHMFYDLKDRKQIPGERHLRSLGRMEPPHWRGIYDDDGRMIVGINHNMDMGDAWEHADDPNYPAAMTVQAYQLGVNYVMYVMTH